MGAPRKFDAETRERAVRMYRDRLAGAGDTKVAARKHVGALLDINPATIRNWVEKDEPPSGQSEAEPGVDRDAELKALRRENSELRRANEILKTASAFFAAAEVDRRLR
ncbi:MAG: transposase-like protein [Rhodococcus sp. (in: high G+C Gram-positive bacteria)]|jgi:transposase|nr:transposase [Rhodococcus sp. CUA-806]